MRAAGDAPLSSSDPAYRADLDADGDGIACEDYEEPAAPQYLVPSTTAEPDPVPDVVYFSSCPQARAAGAAPLYAGDPGYRAGLDRDDDGVACE